MWLSKSHKMSDSSFDASGMRLPFPLRSNQSPEGNTRQRLFVFNQPPVILNERARAQRAAEENNTNGPSQDEEPRVKCVCKSKCKTKTKVAGQNSGSKQRGCPCKTAGIQCGINCKCQASKCENKVTLFYFNCLTFWFYFSFPSQGNGGGG